MGRNKSKVVHPKDLQVKIGSREEQLWTEFRDATQQQLDSLERQLTVNRAILAMCEEKIVKAQKDYLEGKE